MVLALISSGKNHRPSGCTPSTGRSDAVPRPARMFLPVSRRATSLNDPQRLPLQRPVRRVLRVVQRGEDRHGRSGDIRWTGRGARVGYIEQDSRITLNSAVFAQCERCSHTAATKLASGRRAGTLRSSRSKPPWGRGEAKRATSAASGARRPPARSWDLRPRIGQVSTATSDASSPDHRQPSALREPGRARAPAPRSGT